MKNHVWMIVLVLVVALLLLLYSVTFIVEFKQIAIVKTFGHAGEPIMGTTHAGLHWKLPWPIQSLVRYDARDFIFDDTHETVLTSDGQNVLITVFCAWRIQDPGKFLRSIETVDKAEARLRDTVRGIKADVLGDYPLGQMINVAPEQMRLSKIEDRMRRATAQRAANEYGVQITALGIKAQGLPKSVADKVMETLKEERNRLAEGYRGSGSAVAEAIKSRAQTAKDTILAFANRRAENIRAEGTRAAAEFYPQFKENERFAMFLDELAFLRESLKENTVFLIDPSLQESFGFFKDGPHLPSETPPKPPTTRPAP